LAQLGAHGESSLLVLLGCGLAWRMVLVGIFAAVTIMAHVFFVFLWLATVVVLITVVSRYFAAERQSLLWMLTVAAERGIPLESAARAFGQERHDRIGARAMLLADYLEAGVPLRLALQRSGNTLPAAAMLAADLGQETGNLAAALRNVASQFDESESALRSALAHVFYLAFLVLFSSLMLTFLMIKIVPMYDRMFDRFGLHLPAATELLISFSNAVVDGSLFFIPVVIIGILTLLGAIFWYIGLAPRGLPVIHRLWSSADCATVLRWLAISVRQQLPLSEVLRALATRFPQPSMRGRLEQASRRIDRGGNWCDSLRQAGVIRRSDAILFKSAERTGNLAWAFDEMAESGVRRSVYRLRTWINILFPVVLLAFGAAVLFIALGILMPLITMIQVLS